MNIPHSLSTRALGRPLAALFCGGVLASAAVSSVHAQATATFTSLYSFNGNDASFPDSALTLATDGNLYGTATDGGPYGDFGTIFRITTGGDFTGIYGFTGPDGRYPYAGLVQGPDGNFYGTTYRGGANKVGTLYQATSTGTLITLHTFNTTDGALPVAGLIAGPAGNFYGVTSSGGNSAGDGTVFAINSAGVFSTLHQFNYGDGSDPESNLVLGRDGNFYGTTSSGGSGGLGTVFQLTPSGVLTTLHSFSGGDGQSPLAGLVQGSDGNFYGTTYGDGYSNYGNVFEITSAGYFTVLHTFNGNDGAFPVAGLVQGSDGNFYGAASSGGAYNSGSLFQVTSSGGFSLLYSFTNGADGSNPQGALVQGPDGSFYGTAADGGANGDYGTIYKLTVSAFYPAFFNGATPLANGVYYLAFPNGNYFGYYSFLSDPRYIYHFDLGYEYVFDAGDGVGGVYFYDFKSNDFFYTSPVFPFPYLYDFNLKSVVYYYPDPTNAGHYNTNGVRYFYVFSTGQIISK